MANEFDAEFYYDVVCPFAYMATFHVESIAKQCNATISWQPVLLGGLYGSTKAKQGKAGSATDVMSFQKKKLLAQDARLQFLRHHMQANKKFDFNWHPKHPVKSIHAMRLLCAITDQQKRIKLTRAIYKAIWVDNVDIEDVKVIQQVYNNTFNNNDNNGNSSGNNSTSFDVEKAINSTEAKELLHSNTERAFQFGAFGVPAFWVKKEQKLIWGSDRLHFLSIALGNKTATPFRITQNYSNTSSSSNNNSLASSTHAAKILNSSYKKITVVFFHDFSSPWSFIASTQAQRVIATANPNAIVKWTPILLGALFRDIGGKNMPIESYSDAKRVWAAGDMQNWIKYWQNQLANTTATTKYDNYSRSLQPFQFPPFFPIRTVLPLRVSLINENDDKLIHTIYHAAWIKHQNIGDKDVLRDVLLNAGYSNADDLIQQASTSTAIKDKLRYNTQFAKDSGACGVPSFLIQYDDNNRNENCAYPLLYWGQDRLNVVADLACGWIPNTNYHLNNNATISKL